MNNNYYNFNPQLRMNRAIPFTPINPVLNPKMTNLRSTSNLPRLSSLFATRTLPQATAGGLNGIGASKITFSSLLNGASKTLGVINQAIPVFYQVKPVWNNAKTMFRVIKEVNTSEPKQTNQTTSTTDSQNYVKTKQENSNSPTFFV